MSLRSAGAPSAYMFVCLFVSLLSSGFQEVAQCTISLFGRPRMIYTRGKQEGAQGLWFANWRFFALPRSKFFFLG